MKKSRITSFFPFKKLVLDACSFKVTVPVVENDSQEYDACIFEVDQLKVAYRNAKITPTKIGQFVTLWKRNSVGPIQPFDYNDPVDLVVINTSKDNKLGQFVFPKSVLIDKAIMSTNMKEGKRGFRVYPPWDITTSNQARKTQSWQLMYFLLNGNPMDVTKAKKLFLK